MKIEGGIVTSPMCSGNEWKCSRFWYRIGSGRNVQLKVFLNISEAVRKLWTTAHRKTGCQFVQLTINAEGTAQVNNNAHRPFYSTPYTNSTLRWLSVEGEHNKVITNFENEVQFKFAQKDPRYRAKRFRRSYNILT